MHLLKKLLNDILKMSQLVCHCIKEYLGNLVDLFNFHTRTVDSIITEHSLYFLDHFGSLTFKVTTKGQKSKQTVYRYMALL